MALLESEQAWPNIYERLDFADETAFLQEEMVHFKTEHQEIYHVEERAPLAINFVANARSYLEIDDSQSWNLPPRLGVKTQLDVIEWIALKDLRVYLGGGIRTKGQTDSDLELGPLDLAAKARALSDIGMHDRLSGGSPYAYDSLLDTFHQARMLVRNPQDFMMRRDNLDRIELDQILKIYRLGKALRHINLAGYNTPSTTKEAQKFNYRLPLGRKQHVDLRIQPALPNADGLVTVNTGSQKVGESTQLLVELENHERFSIGKANRQRLKEDIRHASEKILGIAAVES